MRVLVCGGRDYHDQPRVFQVLDAMGITELVQGGANGADACAQRWAEARNVPSRCFRADWEAHGRAAGPIRNQQMLDEGEPDMVVAFPGGRGTADMVRRARRAGIAVRVVDEDSDSHHQPVMSTRKEPR